MQKPWVLFDIDGVLNPFFNDLADFTGFESFHTPFSSWLVNGTLHGSWLRRLEQLAEFRWASMWRERSNALNGVYNLRHKTYAHIDWLDWFPETNQTYKLPSIKYAVGAKRPVVWVDDELEQDVYDWADERGRTLLIHCDPTQGWTESEYESVLFFLANLKDLTRLKTPIEHRVLTRLHRLRQIAADAGLSELRLLQQPAPTELTFGIQLTDVGEISRSALVAELTDLLGVQVVLRQLENGRKGSILLWKNR